MLFRTIVAAALLTPAVAFAQVRPATPVSVEIIGNGEIDAPASAITMTVTYSATGGNESAAEAARAAKLAEIMAALRVQGVPAEAVTDPAEGEGVAASTTINTIDAAIYEADAEAGNKKKDEDAAPPEYTSTASKVIKTISIAQANAVREALDKLAVTVGEPNSTLADYPGTMRQAKALALRNARADADAYAKELGLHVTRVARISEAGNQLFLPGLQDKLQRAITSGPAMLQTMFKPKPGIVHVEAGIIVTFEMAP